MQKNLRSLKNNDALVVSRTTKQKGSILGYQETEYVDIKHYLVNGTRLMQVN